MYSDRLGDLDALLGKDTAKKAPAPAEAERSKLDQAVALAIANIALLQVRYEREMLPALRAAARAQLEFALAAYRAGRVYASFAGSGLDIPAPESLTRVDAADVNALATAMLGAKLLDEHDEILGRLPPDEPEPAK